MSTSSVITSDAGTTPAFNPPKTGLANGNPPKHKKGRIATNNGPRTSPPARPVQALPTSDLLPGGIAVPENIEAKVVQNAGASSAPPVKLNGPDVPSTNLSQSLAELRKREAIIRQGKSAWQTGATALVEIRDLRLYLTAGYTEFGRYCREKLDMGKSTVNRQIAIGEVYSAVASTGATTLPTSERQMRPLLWLRRPEQQAAVWRRSVAQVWTKAVQNAEILKKPLTEASVTSALDKLDPKHVKNQPTFDVKTRWTRLEAYLEDEREFWPAEHRPFLSEHVVALVRCWKVGMKHLPQTSTASESEFVAPNHTDLVTQHTAAPDEPVT